MDVYPVGHTLCRGDLQSMMGGPENNYEKRTMKMRYFLINFNICSRHFFIPY